MTDDELNYLVEHYKPDTRVLEALAGAKVLAIVGPSAVGKTSLMEMAVKKSPLFGMIGSVTSRQKRPGEKDDEFVFLPKELVIKAIQEGLFVQVAVGPAGVLYATRLQDYPIGKVGLKAVFSHAIPGFRHIFADLKVTFIVPATYEAWMQRFNDRESQYDDAEKRLQEAQSCIEFALNDQSTHFILNDQLEQAVDRLIQVAEGQKPDDEDQARQLAAQYLERLKTQKV